MPYKEIKELRQAGKLDEALQMAHQALEVEPENIWNKRAAAWVYYDLLKENAQPETYEAFKENLIKIKDLQLPADKKMLFDNCAWQIGSLVFALQKAEPVDYGKINDLFEIIKDLHFTKPSEAYSFIYKAFHKGYQNWANYMTFADWWNFDNLRSEDYLKEEFKGKKMMSIAEQAYIAYAKKLLAGEAIDPFGQQRLYDKVKIPEFLPKLNTLIEKHPDYLYPAYFKAKLLLALGDKENMLSALLPFARKKKNDFWVWDVLAEAFPSEEEKVFACYCRALSCNGPAEMLVNVRQKLAHMLIKRKEYSNAKTEIELLTKARIENGYKLPNEVLNWQGEEWYKNAQVAKSNLDFYNDYTATADAIIFSDIPEETVLVEFVNSDKKMLNFIASDEKFGFFKYDRFLAKVNIGDTLKVRFKDGSNGGPFQIHTASIAEDAEFKNRFFKKLEGVIQKKEDQSFGFVDDVYVHPSIIKKYQLDSGTRVQCSAIKSYNREKKRWGWKVLDIKVKQP
jgi:hypothetical protein